MLIACPSCSSIFKVNASKIISIPTLKCAKCKHQWNNELISQLDSGKKSNHLFWEWTAWTLLLVVVLSITSLWTITYHWKLSQVSVLPISWLVDTEDEQQVLKIEALLQNNCSTPVPLPKLASIKLIKEDAEVEQLTFTNGLKEVADSCHVRYNLPLPQAVDFDKINIQFVAPNWSLVDLFPIYE